MKKTLKKLGIAFLTFTMVAAASYKGDFFEVSKNLEIYSDIYKTP